jgi:hypothetical protein
MAKTRLEPGMRHRLPILALFALLVFGAVAGARGEIRQEGNLRISFDGGFAPRSLPRDRPAPVTVTLEGRISTTDGSHPPALQTLEVAVNRHGRILTRGLPTCRAPLLQTTSSQAALRRCGGALVGRGSFTAVLDSTEGPIPADGKLLAFNGSARGHEALLLHFHANRPVQATLVLPFTISRRAEGRFGTVLTTVIPNLAGGLGSITSIDLKIGREFSHRGHRVGFVSASCAALPGFPGATFTFARGSFHFADGRVIAAPLSRNCRVR